MILRMIMKILMNPENDDDDDKYPLSLRLSTESYEPENFCSIWVKGSKHPQLGEQAWWKFRHQIQ